MLSLGNAKLGAIANFSLPPGRTCPGMTEFCHRYCYGARNWYKSGRMASILRRNEVASERLDFIAKMIYEITASKSKVVRLHVTGDFYSKDYISKWIEIVCKLPSITFYGYTRSWRVDELIAPLAVLSTLRNVSLRASVDFTMDEIVPDRWPIFSVVVGQGLHCPHDLGKLAHCIDCRKCWTTDTPIWTTTRWSRRWTNLSRTMISDGL